MQDDFFITIRAARTNLGLTRQETADLLEIHYDTLRRYEADSTNIPRSVFVKFEKVFGIPVERFYFGKEKDFYKRENSRLKEVLP